MIYIRYTYDNDDLIEKKTNKQTTKMIYKHDLR